MKQQQPLETREKRRHFAQQHTHKMIWEWRKKTGKKFEIENYTNNLWNGNIQRMKCGLNDMRHVLLMFFSRSPDLVPKFEVPRQQQQQRQPHHVLSQCSSHRYMMRHEMMLEFQNYFELTRHDTRVSSQASNDAFSPVTLDGRSIEHKYYFMRLNLFDFCEWKNAFSKPNRIYWYDVCLCMELALFSSIRICLFGISPWNSWNLHTILCKQFVWAERKNDYFLRKCSVTSQIHSIIIYLLHCQHKPQNARHKRINKIAFRWRFDSVRHNLIRLAFNELIWLVFV